jgi:hypothetical protein
MEWAFTETGDAHTTQAPKRFGMAVRGTFQWPQLVMEYFRWNTSRISFYRSWTGNALRADVYRDSTDSPFTNVMNSPYNEAIAIGSLQTWGFEYVDLPGEAGGASSSISTTLQWAHRGGLQARCGSNLASASM